jgi:cell division protein FtsB
MSIADRVVVVPQWEYDEMNAEIAKLRAQNEQLREALAEIANDDSIQHIARKALTNEQEGK